MRVAQLGTSGLLFTDKFAHHVHIAYMHMQTQGIPPRQARVRHPAGRSRICGPSTWDPCSEMRCRESVVCPVLVCSGLAL